MVRFGICDTDDALLTGLAGMLHRLYDPCKIQYIHGAAALEVFLSSGGGEVDILLTEIELNGKNAIELVRENLPQSSPMEVVYMTKRIEYCTQVYQTRHGGFLIKPLEWAELDHTVQRLLQEVTERKEYRIAIHKGSNVYVVKASALMYVEGRGRILHAVTECETLDFYGKLTEFMERLDQRFLQCHKSYAVNMERVARFQGESFLMETGIQIPISQSRRREVRECFLNYMGSAAVRSKV